MDVSFLEPEFTEKVYAEVVKRSSSNPCPIPEEIARTIKSVISALLKQEHEYIVSAEQDVAPRRQQLLSRYAAAVLRRDEAVKRIDEAKEDAIRRLKRKLESHEERWEREGPRYLDEAGVAYPDESDFTKYKWFGGSTLNYEEYEELRPEIPR
jgi:hypothetical protein